MSEERKERCETCRFWERCDRDEMMEFHGGPPWGSEYLEETDPNYMTIGRCKRFPPTVSDRLSLETVETIEIAHRKRMVLDEPAIVLSGTIFPVTWDSDSCGEYQPKSTGVS